jgi:hypothetical protein
MIHLLLSTASSSLGLNAANTQDLAVPLLKSIRNYFLFVGEESMTRHPSMVSVSYISAFPGSKGRVLSKA